MIGDRYDMEDPIGRGSMGTVYRASRRLAPGGQVAIKRVPVAADPELRSRLRAEAEVLAWLDHPHIVRVLELIDDGDGVAVVMPLAVGGSLADRLVQVGRMRTPEVVRMATAVAGALGSAHGHGVLHCDVKPSNILFTSDGEALLTDFGLARWVARPSVWGAAVTGTAEYLDPEVADGGLPDGRSDVYSLAVVCYEALTGRVPFSGPTPLAVLRNAARGRAAPVAELVPDVPRPLSELVARGMARRRSRRPESAAVFAAALSRLGLDPPSQWQGVVGDEGIRTTPDDGDRAASNSLSRSADGPPTAHFALRPLGRADVAPPGSEERPGRTPLRRAGLIASLAIAPALVVVALLAGRSGMGPGGAGSGGPRWRPTVVVGLAVGPSGQFGTSSRRAVSCPGPAPPARPDVVVGDVWGDGCPIGVSWDGDVAGVAAAGGGPISRFQFGRPGDQLLLGDWTCQGRALPGLYRPDTGEVILFPGWADAGRPLASSLQEATGMAQGTAAVVPGGRTACDRVEVRPGPITRASPLEAAGKETP